MSKTMTKELPCPGCGFMTCEDNYGNYCICSICDWEDDRFQLANPLSDGGANRISLFEAQQEILKNYPTYIDIAQGIARSKNWRPLTEDETKNYKDEKHQKQGFKKAIFDESEAYWYKNS